MNGISLIQIIELSVTSVSVLLLGSFFASIIYESRIKKLAVSEIRQASGINIGIDEEFATTGIPLKVLVYISKTCKKLEFSDNSKLIVHRFVKSQDLKSKVERYALMSGLPPSFDNYIYREIQLKIAVICGSGLMLFGIVLSNAAGLIGLFAGCILGLCMPFWAMKQEKECKTNLVENSLSEMLEVVALGLRSGLSFDRSLSLYQKHFTNELSRACMLAMNKWNSGIQTREEALRDMTKKYDCEQLNRVVENIIRSLRFGTSLASSLEDAAVEARNLYKSKREEAVAKAPVKMMIPTGTLILPAMLLLVLGPVLLELMGGF